MDLVDNSLKSATGKIFELTLINFKANSIDMAYLEIQKPGGGVLPPPPGGKGGGFWKKMFKIGGLGGFSESVQFFAEISICFNSRKIII